jgi:ribosomal protein L37AE/L43A|tara:strand:+ start:192 stop:719 length:528 start_codon:yes stop_codon:yes gene_type:complete
MGRSRESVRENTAMRSILRGETPEKRIIVGYEGDKKTTNHGDKISNLSNIMQEARMPWFCPFCKKTMKKRLDNKMWYLYNHCFDCQVDLENKMRIEGTFTEWAQQKVIANKLAWIRDEKVKLIEFKKQDEPTFYNQVAADGETLDKEKWSVNIQKLKEQADEALNHLQKIEDFLT